MKLYEMFSIKFMRNISHECVLISWTVLTQSRQSAEILRILSRDYHVN